MYKIFISGSISIKKLPQNAIKKIDSVAKKEFNIILGDASGIDSGVQKYLFNRGYKNVTVYYAGKTIRNNIGNWNSICVGRDSKLTGRKLYTLKDLQMAKDSDYGIMIWDNKSKGTYNNMVEMQKQGKQFYVITKENSIIDNKTFFKNSNRPVQQLLDFGN